MLMALSRTDCRRLLLTRCRRGSDDAEWERRRQRCSGGRPVRSEPDGRAAVDKRGGRRRPQTTAADKTAPKTATGSEHRAEGTSKFPSMPWLLENENYFRVKTPAVHALNSLSDPITWICHGDPSLKNVLSFVRKEITPFSQFRWIANLA